MVSARAVARRLALANGAELAIDHVSGFERDFLYRRFYQLDNFSIPCRKATAAEHRVLAKLSVLTPGDYAAVARRHHFQPLPDPKAWIEALTAECALKEPPRRPLGFGAG
jgi:hypothetical protein